MTYRNARAYTLVLPVLAVLVSGGIVTWEYVRRAALSADLARTEREYARLNAMRPTAQRVNVRDFEAKRHDHHTD